jgi:molecular chaperone Hsp33
MEEPDPGIEVRTYFARGRNALVARAEFSELYAALYLHQMDVGLRPPKEWDQLLRDALAAISLHSASRPRDESFAWTVNFQNPRANVFVAGDNPTGTVVGRVFTDNVREAAGGIFYADAIEAGKPPRRSVVEFSGGDFLRAAEIFYERSEQRPARFFRYGEEDLVLISAQPDCDLDWLRGLTEESIRQLDREVELSLLEQRRCRFACGCNQARMLTMLLPVLRKQGDDLFEGEETLRVQCPRCGARHILTRESVEARLAAE